MDPMGFVLRLHVRFQGCNQLDFLGGVWFVTLAAKD